MASLSPSQGDRQRRLVHIATEWGIARLPPLSPPARPQHPPTCAIFRTPADDVQAEDLLRRQRAAGHSNGESSNGGIKRAFTTKKKSTWDPKEVFDALDAHVAKMGSPGVAEALIAKLVNVGGDINVASSKTKTNLLTRRRSMESLERSRILQKAVENQHTDMVHALAPHADSLALNSCLAQGIRSRSVEITRLLLQHGASVSETAAGQDAFRRLCIEGNGADLIALVLASDGRPPPEVVSEAMVDAAKKGCLDSVLRLSYSTADGNHNGAEALQEAILQCRVDIALAILTGTRVPTGHALNKAFDVLFSHANIMPNEKMALTDMLLCAGADGDIVARALLQAAQSGFSEMVELLVYHGASIEYQDASVLRWAISQKKCSLASQLLTEKATLSAVAASECAAQIPRDIDNGDRFLLLDLLLRKGAGGRALNVCLVDAAKAADTDSVKLLLTHRYPGSPPLDQQDARRGPRRTVQNGHNVASIDYNDGVALRDSVLAANIPMVKIMLASGPARETLHAVFPCIAGLPVADRYHMAECFLLAGLSGTCVSEALQLAIKEGAPRRDERYIGLLLRHNADPTFDGGANIVAAVVHRDVALLETLLHGGVSPQVAAAAVPPAMAVADPGLRLRIVSLLLAAGAGVEGHEVGRSLVAVLRASPPTEMPLLDVLLNHGTADVNFQSGAPIALAVQNPDPQVLDLVLRTGRAAPETVISAGFRTLEKLPSVPSKAVKLDSLLRFCRPQAVLNDLLITEVVAVLECPPPDRLFSVLKSLLTAGADVNAHKASALCRAVEAACAHIADMLFARLPSPASLAFALPYALVIADAMDRMFFAQKLLQLGAPPAQVNRALLYALESHPSDLPLIKTLAAKAESGDGKALFLAVSKANSGAVKILLKRPYTSPILNDALNQARDLTDKGQRQLICASLVEAGASGATLSDALLTAASDGDVELVNVLVGSGASVDHQEGQAVVEAARSGSGDVLGMLLRGPAAVRPATLERAFRAATEVSDPKARHNVLRLLLKMGVQGEVVDRQLVIAARDGEEGLEFVRLLLEFGASPDHNQGEAVWTSTRNSFLPGLELMLGLIDLGNRQRKPSERTMLRALKASWRLPGPERYQVITWLFKAGLLLTEAVHISLNKAVNETEPSLELIRLLLRQGASPLTNGCRTLADATEKLLAPVLALFLESEIPVTDLSWAFSQAFTPRNADAWLSERGYNVAEMLLEKGAQGDGPPAALAYALDSCGTDRDAISRRFVDLLVQQQLDVDSDRGVALRAAARLGETDTIERLLDLNPTADSVSMAFPYIFDVERVEDEVLDLVRLFAGYSDGEERLDVMFAHPESDPVVFRALAHHPRSTKLVEALLDSGYYYDQMAMARVMPEVEEDEPVSLLFWALLQPQKRISSRIIELLVRRGAKVNFETKVSKTTPLMLAIQAKRHDLVKLLILEGADVDLADITKNTPLTMATRVGGELGTMMMSNILAAEPSENDGSLHNAARELNLPAMRILIEHKHHVDFPSPLHGGRSALAEICLHASDLDELTAAKEKEMEKAMAFLIKRGTNLGLQSEGKSVLLLAMESRHPVPTTRILLKVGMWEHINDPSNNYSDGTHTYSPTMYLQHVLTPSDVHEQLLALLRGTRAQDVYYANSGPQPANAVNLPSHLQHEEKLRAARRDRLATEADDHQRAIAYTQETAQIQDQIAAHRAELEEARAQRQRDAELDGARARGLLEEQLWTDAMQRTREERREALDHRATAGEADLTRTKLLGDTEFEMEGRRQLQRLEAARELSALRQREGQDQARLEQDSHARFQTRVQEQRRLVDAQTTLASRFGDANGPAARRQIGYVTGELD